MAEFEDPGDIESEGTKNKGPERECIQAREGHVACTNLQGHKEVKECRRQRHDAQEDHRRPVHRKHLVIHRG